MRFLSLFLISVSLTIISCRLKIISPDSLKASFDPDTGIPYETAKYGKIPYGSNLVGNLKMADPEDACTNLLPAIQKGEQTIHNLILLVRRGGCKYTIKTQYAQLAGAKLVIIIGDTDNLLAPLGFDQDSISIPTLLIKKSDGDLIQNALVQAEKADEQSAEAYVQASITFPFGPLTDKVSLDFWFSTSDSIEGVYAFLNNFKSFYLQSQDDFEFHPHYVTAHCGPCKANGYIHENVNCLSGGRYCAPDPDATGILTGADVVYEDLRQICLWKTASDKWWNYIELFTDQCKNKPIQPTCSNDILPEAGLSSGQIEALNKCIVESFIRDPARVYNKALDENTILREELLLQEEYDIAMFPSLFINHHIYQGELKEAAVIFKAACESLKEPSDLCLEYTTETISTKIDATTIIIFVIILVIVVLIILFFYRRMIKREMNKEMSIQVSQMVSQYFALNDVRRLEQ